MHLLPSPAGRRGDGDRAGLILPYLESLFVLGSNHKMAQSCLSSQEARRLPYALGLARSKVQMWPVSRKSALTLLESCAKGAPQTSSSIYRSSQPGAGNDPNANSKPHVTGHAGCILSNVTWFLPRTVAPVIARAWC